MSPTRKTALVAGVFFLITFATSIPAVLLYDPVLNNTRFIVGAGADTRVFFGAFLEILLAIANIGTAVVLFPILKRQRESVALDRTGDLILTKDVLYRLSYVSDLRLHLRTTPAERETGLEPATSSLEG